MLVGLRWVTRLCYSRAQVRGMSDYGMAASGAKRPSRRASRPTDRLWKLSFASGGGGRRRERKCEGGTCRLRGGLWIAGQSDDDRRPNTERNDLRTHGAAARRDNDQGRPSRTRQF